MPAVKICGITRPEDALCVAQCGADALGFIFYPRSPRYITPEKVKHIMEGFPAAMDNGAIHDERLFPSRGRLTTIGVFVNEDIRTIQEITTFCGLDLIQLHGDESADDCRRFPPGRVIKAFALRTDADLQRMQNYQVRAMLVDAYDPVHHGGTGRISNWDLAARALRTAPLILSGGLHSGNIREALEAVHPDAVDISSGVEISPGIKDHEKVRTIIDLIRKKP